MSESHHAPAIAYCASVSPNLRCVSANVRQTAASVSGNVRRKQCSIARRAVHHCAPLHIESGQPRRPGARPARDGASPPSRSWALESYHYDLKRGDRARPPTSQIPKIQSPFLVCRAGITWSRTKPAIAPSKIPATIPPRSRATIDRHAAEAAAWQAERVRYEQEIAALAADRDDLEIMMLGA
jgi:hypothetical protein